MEPATVPTPETNPMPPSEQSPIAQQFEQPSSNPAASPNKLPGAFELFKPSWAAIKLNLGTFIALLVVPVAFLLATSLLQFGAHWGVAHNNVQLNGTANASLNAVALVVGLVFVLFILLVLGPALVYSQLKSVAGQKVQLGESLRQGLHFSVRFIGLSLVVGLLVTIGFILLIVPGLILLRRYYLASYFLVGQDVSIGVAMAKSASASKANSGAVWGVIGVEFLIGLINIIPLLGWVVSTVLNIMYTCAPAIRYEQLKNLAD